MAATSAATQADSCKMRTSGSRSRRRRRVGSSRCYAAISNNANALPLRSGSLSLAATALSLSQRATEKERDSERESERIRVSALAQDLPVLAFSAGVQALQSRATKSRAAQQLRSASIVSSWLLVRAYSESLSA